MQQFSCPSLIISYLRPHNGGDKRFFKKAMSSSKSVPDIDMKLCTYIARDNTQIGELL